MLEAARAFIFAVLDPIGIVVGLIAAVPIFWTWWQVVFGERRRIRRLYRELRANPGNRPGILLCDFLPGRDARLQVEQFRQRSEELKRVPAARIVTIVHEKQITPDAVPALQDKLRRAARALMGEGVDRIHLFYAGPAALAAMIGAEFANMPVTVYQYAPSSGSYVSFGPLRLPL